MRREGGASSIAETVVTDREAAAYWIARLRGRRHRNRGEGVAFSLLLLHQAPFGDHGLAHLAGIVGAGDLVDLYRDLLAGKRLQLRGLRVAGGDELKSLGAGLEV